MIHLVPDQPAALGPEAARTTAAAAYARAKTGQADLVSNLALSALLVRIGPIGTARLRGELHAATQQLERARTVVDALSECLDAARQIAATPSPTTSTDRGGSDA